jgi:hypothetical protein
LDQEVLTLNCRVIWSRAVGRATLDPGGTGLLYHSGLEFSGLTRESQAVLEAYLKNQGL